MTEPRLFGTLFYANYLTRALALYRSLERHCNREFCLVMLCMDARALAICQQLYLPQARLVSVDEIERRDPELAIVKPARTIAEYSWTCTAPLLIYLLDQIRPGETAVYLDADLMFFSDPQPIVDEWGLNDIVIHEHGFTPRFQNAEAAAGIFNVGWVGIRNSSEGRRCLARWRAQCIEACAMDSARGLCGDQKYLDEWPALYDHLTVLRNKGAGVGPWNIERFEIATINGTPQIDGMPLIFYHYQGMRIVRDRVFGHIAIIPGPAQVRFSRLHKRLLYAPYARALRAAQREVNRVAVNGEIPANRLSLWKLAKMMRWADILYAR